MNPDSRAIADILSAAGTIAVVGLSADPSRTSHRIAAYLQEAGYRVVPVNPNVERVLGEKAHSRLGEIEERVDIVNVFRRSGEIPALADEALKKRPRAFWMQKGVPHPAAARRLEVAGIASIQDLCIKVAHRGLAPTPL